MRLEVRSQKLGDFKLIVSEDYLLKNLKGDRNEIPIF